MLLRLAPRRLARLRSAPPEVSVEQVGTLQNSVAEFSVAQVGVVQVGIAKTGAAQVGAAQFSYGQIGLPQVGAVQVGMAQVDADQISAAQVGSAQFSVAQVWPYLTVGITPIIPHLDALLEYLDVFFVGHGSPPPSEAAIVTGDAVEFNPSDGGRVPTPASRPSFRRSLAPRRALRSGIAGHPAEES